MVNKKISDIIFERYKKMEIKENERIDELGIKDLKIIQNKEWFCFGIDSVLLVNFAKNIKKDANVLDLGTGSGVMPILLCGKTELKKVVGDRKSTRLNSSHSH